MRIWMILLVVLGLSSTLVGDKTQARPRPRHWKQTRSAIRTTQADTGVVYQNIRILQQRLRDFQDAKNQILNSLHECMQQGDQTLQSRSDSRVTAIWNRFSTILENQFVTQGSPMTVRQREMLKNYIQDYVNETGNTLEETKKEGGEKEEDDGWGGKVNSNTNFDIDALITYIQGKIGSNFYQDNHAQNVFQYAAQPAAPVYGPGTGSNYTGYGFSMQSQTGVGF